MFFLRKITKALPHESVICKIASESREANWEKLLFVEIQQTEKNLTF